MDTNTLSSGEVEFTQETQIEFGTVQSYDGLLFCMEEAKEQGKEGIIKVYEMIR